MAHALVLGNRGDAHTGLVGAALEARGFEQTVLLRESEEWPEQADADLVVPMGSEWSVYDEAVRQPVDRERAVLADAVARGVPVLGICFGAQVLASALGGDSYAAARPEVGWIMVDPVEGSPIEPGRWFVWHEDTFSLPPGATLLADGEVGPHAFSYGSALGVQFHPEVTPEIVRRWAKVASQALERAGVDARELVEQTAKEQPGAAERAARLIDLVLT